MIVKYYILLILFIFFGCASQAKPGGGPIDKDGPVLVNLYPNNNSIISDNQTKIILEFNEAINPISVVNSIEILNFSEFDYKVQGKKITLSPKKQWPSFNTIKIIIKRSITDMLDNQISEPIQLFYFNQNIDYNKVIKGNIININDDIYELGLYQIINDEYLLIEKLQSNLNGEFQFSYLSEGQYIIVAMQHSITNIFDDIKTKKFGFISQDYIDLNMNDTSQVLIQIDNPLEKFAIKSFNQINNNFGYLILSNGFEHQFIIPKKDSIQNSYLKGDSLIVDIKLKNRIQDYTTPKFKISINNIIDTIPPKIKDHYLENDRYYMLFDEPILNTKIYTVTDSLTNEVSYEFINPFSITFNPIFHSSIYISNINDLYNNVFKDTISINIETPNSIEGYQGGNVYGKINYKGLYPIMIKAEDLNSESIYYNYLIPSLSNKNFSFLDMKPGFYRFSAYEIMSEHYDSTQYFSGDWPFKRAAKFGHYHDILEVRNLWDIKDLNIIIK